MIRIIINDLRHTALHESEVNEFILNKEVTKIENHIVHPAKSANGTYYPDIVTIITYEAKP